MRIAVPVEGSGVGASLAACDGFRFFEDDHGKIVRSFFVPREGGCAGDTVAQLEQYGVDALVCGALPTDERVEASTAGLMVFPSFSGTAQDAVLAFLGGAVVRDPGNTCSACGFQSACPSAGKGGCGGA